MNIAGKRIRAHRHQRGWSQELLARKLNITVAGVSKIETGATDINLSRLEQIASVFGLAIVELIKEEGKDDTYIKALPKNSSIAEQQLSAREAEVKKLQNKLIELFEDLRESGPKKELSR